MPKQDRDSFNRDARQEHCRAPKVGSPFVSSVAVASASNMARSATISRSWRSLMLAIERGRRPSRAYKIATVKFISFRASTNLVYQVCRFGQVARNLFEAYFLRVSGGQHFQRYKHPRRSGCCETEHVAWLPIMGIIGTYVMWTLPLGGREHQGQNAPKPQILKKYCPDTPSSRPANGP
jgi:hypothetical protein